MNSDLAKSVYFDEANVRQTALHVMKSDGCEIGLTLSDLEQRLKCTAIDVIQCDLHEPCKMFFIKNMNAWFTVDDMQGLNVMVSDNTPYRVNFYIRVGHREERDEALEKLND